MESVHLDPIVSWILRASIAALFATAAIHKVRQPEVFVETFSEYEILPERFTIPGVVMLVMAESSIAIGLLLDSTRVHASLAGVALLMIYGLAIGLNLARGRREIDCGCLGPANHQPLSNGLVYRNGILAIAAAAICLPVTGRGLQPVDAITLVGGVVVLVLLFQAIGLLASGASRRSNPERIS